MDNCSNQYTGDKRCGQGCPVPPITVFQADTPGYSKFIIYCSSSTFDIYGYDILAVNGFVEGTVQTTETSMRSIGYHPGGVFYFLSADGTVQQLDIVNNTYQNILTLPLISGFPDVNQAMVFDRDGVMYGFNYSKNKLLKITGLDPNNPGAFTSIHTIGTLDPVRFVFGGDITWFGGRLYGIGSPLTPGDKLFYFDFTDSSRNSLTSQQIVEVGTILTYDLHLPLSNLIGITTIDGSIYCYSEYQIFKIHLGGPNPLAEQVYMFDFTKFGRLRDGCSVAELDES